MPLAVELLGAILADLTYPASVWRIVAAAEVAGADGVTRRHLERLPHGVYWCLGDIRDAALTGIAPRPR